MKAKFIGDQSNPDERLPDEIEMYGIVFPKGKFVEVPDTLAGKIDGNSHFEVQGEK